MLPPVPTRALRALWPFIRPYRRRLILACLMLLLAAASSLALPVAVRMVIDNGFADGDGRALDRYFALLLALSALLAVFSAARFYLVLSLGERVVADLRRAVFERVITLSPAFFESRPSGEVLSRLTADTTLVQSVTGVNLSITLRSLLTLVGGLLMLFITSAWLSTVILLVIPLVLVPMFVVGRRVRRLSRDTQDSIAAASALAGESLNAIQTVQAFTLEPHLKARFASAVRHSYEVAMRRIVARAQLTLFGILLAFGAVVFTLWLGANAVIRGEMSAGELGQFLLFSVLVSGAAAGLAEMWGEIQRAGGALERIVELLAERPQVVAPVEPQVLPADGAGAIELEGVCFEYPSRQTRPALHDVDLSVAAGETVALVGPSGAGKSTLFQLLLRFYDPTRGTLRLDGVDLKRCEPSALRGRIGVVPQETMIFALNLRENIRLGRPDADDVAVQRAADAAGVSEFLDQLPEGYDTFLGERGTRLSGGQRQRV
ncbi:MAG: ATP-binding cassette domain-containing protein, partial [Gammaproteobacteria bacterium]|nr:ATP-binding cassette domain-containing protein [Gammaproteobacteria bacterium]